MSFSRYWFCLAFSLFICGHSLGQDDSPATADPAPGVAAATDEIRKAIEAYVAAFNSQNVEMLGEMCTSECVYTMRSAGQQLVGREAIAKQLESVLSEDEAAPKLAVQTDSIEFLSPLVALERGTAVVTRGDDDVSETQYTVVYVKLNDGWLIDRITEEEVAVAASNYEYLKGLEWMIGEWVDAGEGFAIEMQCDWTANQNYISRKYSVSSEAGIESSGLQIIGWDAKEETIRSWLFDSDGGFISGTWTDRDGQWVVQSVATLADGSSGSFTSIFRPQDDGTYTWQKVNQVVDGKLLPNIDEIVVQRK